MALTKIPASLLDTSGGLDLQGNITLGDNEQIQLGTGNDLRIYHDGSHSRIVENGTGNLIIQGTNLDLTDTATGETFLRAVSNSSVEVYYDGLKKFETSSTGATVTGDLAVTGDLNITGNVNSASVTDLDVTDKTITLGAGQTEALSGGSGIIVDGSSASLLWDESATTWDFNNALNIDSPLDASLTLNKTTVNTWNYLQFVNQGTRNFYVGTNNVSDFVFGADNSGDFYFTGGNVGINESSPNAYLHVTGKASYTTANSSEVSGLGFIRLQPNSDSEHSLWIHNAGNNLGISGYTDASTSSTRDISLQTYGGNVGIGTDSPNGIFNINAGISPSGNNWVNFYNNIGGSNPPDSPGLFVGWNKSNGSGETIIGAGRGSLGASSPQLDFALYNGTTYTTAMTIISNGNVGIGTDTPDYALDVYDVGEAWIRADSSTSTESTANSGLRFAHAGVNHGVLYHRGSDDYLVYFDNISGNTRFEVTNNGSFVLHDGVAHNANAPTHRGSLILAGASGFQNFGGIEFHTSSGGGAGYGTRIVSSDASMFFGRRFNATGWSESMRINNDGWVGIGGINPTSLLDVNGIISIKANDVIDSDGTSHYFKTPSGGAMYFYHGNTQVMYVSSAGLLPGTDNARDLGSTSNRWRNLYTTDLHLSNEGKPEGNEVDGTTGNWTIQEGEEHLYIINNKSGKKYRFALEEIE